ncbi:GNAT family N-acetyltransferase [Bosea sp. (in: a-proteobacteria)]|uniref:GNAT family N-acetyltransferase n=1 Tax=Bosea sp. (in: a-proteobacteria) TaxID=1871050 RepID=UPI0025BFC8D5|nr:GNAT family N-acetyltransferase [Bosea sp. (in: a-proteobacteria)]MBR3193536.1 GNAT family N-acetyltransferase [Bosea sp. (in: a-proteobacteria)]
MDVTIRRAVSQDLSELLSLYAELSIGDELPTPEVAAATWAQMLGSEMVSVLVAEQEGRVVSSCVLVVVPNLTRNQKPFALIENVVTSATMRGRGLGKRVIRAAIDEAWAAGCYKVMLMTGRTDPAVLAFYEGCGFERGKTAFQIRRPAA